MGELLTLDLSEARTGLMAARNTITAPKRRAFEAAVTTRFTENWGSSNLSADLDLWADIPKLRGRARRLAQNNPHAKKFLKLMEKNVIGAKGITFRSKVPNKKGKNLNGKLNKAIETAFAEWSRKQTCTVTGRMARPEMERFAIANCARDGEVFVRRVILPAASGNRFNFTVQYIDPDQLDFTFNNYMLPSGNVVRFGIEFDPYGKVVAYHFWRKHPAEYYPGSGGNQRVRVLASEIVHLYKEERIMQSRGVTWFGASMLTMYSLNRYTDAEILAATFAARKGGFFESENGEAEYQGERDEQKRIIMSAEQGTFEQLPAGLSFKPIPTDHPPTAYEPFIQAAKRDIGAGLDVSYESLANDRKGVNYSSIRAGLLDERDTYRALQEWFITNYCQPIFEWWLESAWLSGVIDLPAGSVPADYFQYFEWHPRGFAWIDPLKDMSANVLAVQNGYESMTQQMAEDGNDFEETIDQIKYEQDYVKQAGVKIGTDTKGAADSANDPNAADDSGGDGNEDDEDDSTGDGGKSSGASDK